MICIKTFQTSLVDELSGHITRSGGSLKIRNFLPPDQRQKLSVRTRCICCIQFALEELRTGRPPECIQGDVAFFRVSQGSNLVTDCASGIPCFGGMAAKFVGQPIVTDTTKSEDQRDKVIFKESSRLEQFSDLVHLIYAASVEPKRWPDAFAAIPQSMQP